MIKYLFLGSSIHRLLSIMPSKSWL